MRKVGWLALSVALMAALSGCGDSGSASTGSSGGTSPDSNKKLKIAVVFDSGGLGDKSFNDSAFRGLERAEKDFGIEILQVVSNSDNDYESNLKGMADKGADLVIAVGINQDAPLAAIAPDYPDTKFAIIDGRSAAPNVRNLLFKEEEGSFLVGYLAGLMSETGKIGFVGGQELDLIKKFQYGYADRKSVV